MARRARRLGPKNDAAQANQAAVARTHCSSLRTVRRGCEEVVLGTRRARKAAVDQAQDHLRKMRLSGLRLEAKAWVAASGWAWAVRKGSDVSR